MNHEPNFFENIRAELSDFRVRADRAIVPGCSVLAGLCVVGFTIAADWAFGHFLSLMASAMLASLISRMISRPLYETLAEHMLRAVITNTPAPEPRASQADVADCVRAAGIPDDSKTMPTP